MTSVDGIVVGGTLKPSAVSPDGSKRLPYGVLTSARYASALSRSSRTLMPRNATPSLFVALYVAASSGASVRQGAQLEAQKLMTTTSPLCAARSNEPPPSNSPVTAGAAVRLLIEMTGPWLALAPPPQPASRTSATRM